MNEVAVVSTILISIAIFFISRSIFVPEVHHVSKKLVSEKVREVEETGLKQDIQPIENKGYENELMQSSASSSVEFQNILLDKQPVLTREGCKISKSLPIANINVSYLKEEGSTYMK